MQQNNSTPPRRRLSDILNGGADGLRDSWNRTRAADEFKPLPAGTYIARVVSGELFTAKTGTPGYKLAFAVLDGEHTGRHFWHDLWLTPVALPMTKRDLSKLGITSVDQLEMPLPAGVRCKVKLALRRDDDGTEHNRVRAFDALGIDEPERDPFAPSDDDGAPRQPDNQSPPSAEGGRDAVPF